MVKRASRLCLKVGVAAMLKKFVACSQSEDEFGFLTNLYGELMLISAYLYVYIEGEGILLFISLYV